MPKHWRLGVVLAVQLAILAAVPAKQVLARTNGTGITLRTRPVDPYDVIAGYYVTLAYEVEDATWRNGPSPKDGDTVYIVIERAQPAWKAVSVQATPEPATKDRVSLRATWSAPGWGMARARLLDAQRLYLPETQHNDVTTRLRGTERALVDLKVGEDGTPAILRMRIGDKSWGQ